MRWSVKKMENEQCVTRIFLPSLHLTLLCTNCLDSCRLNPALPCFSPASNSKYISAVKTCEKRHGSRTFWQLCMLVSRKKRVLQREGFLFECSRKHLSIPDLHTFIHHDWLRQEKRRTEEKNRERDKKWLHTGKTPHLIHYPFVRSSWNAQGSLRSSSPFLSSSQFPDVLLSLFLVLILSFFGFQRDCKDDTKLTHISTKWS